jgi:hypothetical protein
MPAPVAAEPEPAAEGPSPFGEMIDLGAPEGPEIVEVPEAAAPPPRSRPRVRKPVTAVLADVAAAAVEAVLPAREPEAQAEAEAPPAEPEPEAQAEPEPEAQAEPETAQPEAAQPEAAQPEAAEPQAEKAPEGPKRRGWWSRAIGS